MTYSYEMLIKGREHLLSGGVGGGVAPFIVDRASGSYIWDTNGKRYIDCTSQAWSLSVGHNHPKVVAAVSEQLLKYSHIRTSFDTEPKLLLASKLSEIGPASLNKVLFSLSGSEAIEGAMKLALRYTKQSTFVTLWDGYHGRTFATLSISWPHPNNSFTAWGGPVVRVPNAYCYRCPVGPLTYPSCGIECLNVVRKTIKANLSEPPAAIIMEPMQGNGGMIDMPIEYVRGIRQIANEFGSVLVFDEIQTGFGRVGAWSMTQLYDVVPDILVLGKGLGQFPLFYSLSSDKLGALMPGDHSFTFAHFPPSMVSALATIDVLQSEELLGRAATLGYWVKNRLLRLKHNYEIIGDVRGVGLMLGIELVKNRVTKTPARSATALLLKEAMKLGVLFGSSKYGGLGNVVKIKPPLNIPKELMAEALDVLETVLRRL